MEKSLLDSTDIRILQIVQDDASLSIAEIAQKANISQTPCWRRMKKLKDEGVIQTISATVNPESVGLNFAAYAFVKLSLPNTKNMEQFDRLVRIWPEVVLCERITGAVDYLIKVVAEDIKAYDEFLRFKLLDVDLVSDIQSRIVVSTIKSTTALPLDN